MSDDLQDFIDSLKEMQAIKKQMHSESKRDVTQHPVKPLKDKVKTHDDIPVGHFQCPIKGEWKSSGGFSLTRTDYRHAQHLGVDMRVPEGTPIYALNLGVVTNVGTDPKGGNIVQIKHANGIRTYYAHCGVIYVHIGDKVGYNTVIAACSNSGNARNTFSHLHFQVWVNEQITDPAKFFPVPPYQDLTPEEKKRGPWLSKKHHEAAQKFNVQEHNASKKSANKIEYLMKLAERFEEYATKIH